jgi:hypothetical protein
VPLQAGLWNWALPTSSPQSSGSLADDDGLPQASAKKVTHEDIFASFLNALASSLADSELKLTAQHQENVIHCGTLQTTPEHSVVVCSKIQPPDEFTSRTWSIANSTVAIPGSDIKRKPGPDLVLFDDIKPKWGNIRVCAELTSSQYMLAKRVAKVADIQVYPLLSNQPWRCFALILSFIDNYRELRALLYDHSGSVTSPRYKINEDPHKFVQIIAAVALAT